jgi:NCS1 family nucleobase:cation symporter-1
MLIYENRVLLNPHLSSSQDPKEMSKAPISNAQSGQSAAVQGTTDLKALANSIDRTAVENYNPATGQVELTRELPEEGYLWNPDFHPTPFRLRTWGAWTFFAIWIGMVTIVPTWTLSTVGMAFGLGWGTVLALMFLGNLIVLIPTLVQSHGGARYGMAEPQLTRSRWGIYGAQIPSWIRAIISMGWWGVESFIIAEAAGYFYLLVTSPSDIQTLSQHLGPGALPQYFPTVFWTVFALVIIAQLVLFYYSPPTEAQPALKWLARIAAPIMIVGFAVMFYYFLASANFNVSPVLNWPSSVSGVSWWLTMFAFLNSNVAYWATMAVSMPDYTRFAKSQYSQTIGQIPMPLMMMIVGAMGLLAAGAAMSLHWLNITTATDFFGYDPVQQISLHFPAWLSYPLLLVIIIATFSVNVFANTVAPGYDIANTYSKKLSWFRGIVIGVVISLLVGAYASYSSSAHNYIFNWLLAYGALLGAVEGVIFFDYLVIRRLKFESVDSYLTYGRFRYAGGFNPAAIIAFLVGILVTYLSPWKIVDNTFTQAIYANSWIAAFFISGVVYLTLMATWVIPKYQPFLKGSLAKGYISDEVRKLFSKK